MSRAEAHSHVDIFIVFTLAYSGRPAVCGYVVEQPYANKIIFTETNMKIVLLNNRNTIILFSNGNKNSATLLLVCTLQNGQHEQLEGGKSGQYSSFIEIYDNLKLNFLSQKCSASEKTKQMNRACNARQTRWRAGAGCCHRLWHCRCAIPVTA